MDSTGRSRRGPRFWIWTVVAAVAIVAVGGFGLWATGEPWFCASCHEMRTEYAGWQAGTHKDVHCLACHSNPGLLGYLQAHIGDGSRDVWVHFTRWPDKVVPTGRIVPPSRCLACHGSTPNDDVPAFPSPRAFPDHPPRTAYCPECHRGTIHGPKP